MQNITDYLKQVREGLDNATSLADDETKSVASRVASTVEPSVRLALINAISDATNEINDELSTAEVSMSLADGQPVFRVEERGVTVEQLAALGDVDASDDSALDEDGEEDDDPDGSSDDEAQVRFSLRLPKWAKDKVDRRAERAGISTNALLTELIISNVAGRGRGRGWPGPDGRGPGGRGPGRPGPGGRGSEWSGPGGRGRGWPGPGGSGRGDAREEWRAGGDPRGAFGPGGGRGPGEGRGRGDRHGRGPEASGRHGHHDEWRGAAHGGRGRPARGPWRAFDGIPPEVIGEVGRLFAQAMDDRAGSWRGFGGPGFGGPGFDRAHDHAGDDVRPDVDEANSSASDAGAETARPDREPDDEQ